MALVDIIMPQLGTSVIEGTVIEWHGEIGGTIALDATICEISTDKIDTECPAPAGGTLAEILVPVGETVEVGTVLGRIATDGETAKSDGGASNGLASAASSASPLVPLAAGGETATVTSADVRSSPVARRIAADHGIDLAAVPGSGRGGRVTKKDVLDFVARDESAEPAEPSLHSDSPYRPDPPPVSPAAPALAAPSVSTDLGGTAEPLTRIRQLIGNAMRDSQQMTATCHTAVECDMTAVESRRREIGLTALPLVARAVIETLAEFPDLNATLEGTTITRFDRVHLGIAVSLGDDGLIVPVIHDAQNLAPEGLAARIRDLAKRAREKQLQPDEVQGATFTITSPGGFGALWATPVIDVPQVGILDLEAVVRRAVVVADPSGGESIAIRSMANLILGWDHRAMDGVYAARFLTDLRGRLERNQG